MTLQRALLLSIVFHALLLSVVGPPSPLPWNAKAAPIVARLAGPLLEEAPVEAPVKPRYERKPRTVPQETRAAAKAIAEPSRPQPPSAEELEPEQFDPSLVARYRLEIISAARQFRRYPPIARENGWHGKAEVRVSFDGARQPALSISRSSGHAVLDRQAMDTLTKALAPLPAPLAGRAFELDFPVVFSLED
jgi:TonB family protein